MCTGLEIAAVIGATASVYSAYSNSQKASDAAAATPGVQAPTAPPKSQAAATPAQNTFKKNLGGLPGGGDPTLLTGPDGVANDSLTLGKSTLLGS